MERDPATHPPGRSSTEPEATDGGRSILAAEGAVVWLEDRFLSADAASDLMATLTGRVRWEQHHIRMFGRTIPCPRLSAWYGDDAAVYRYSGLTLQPLPWLSELALLRDQIEDAVGAPFNSVLLNLYRDGRDSMGWHADDEPELGEEPVIASLSLGATRSMRFRRKGDPARRRALELAHGSLLVMAGSTQTHWQHEIPKTRTAVGPRINLTFRRILAR